MEGINMSNYDSTKKFLKISFCIPGTEMVVELKAGKPLRDDSDDPAELYLLECIARDPNFLLSNVVCRFENPGKKKVIEPLPTEFRLPKSPTLAEAQAQAVIATNKAFQSAEESTQTAQLPGTTSPSDTQATNIGNAILDDLEDDIPF